MIGYIKDNPAVIVALVIIVVFFIAFYMSAEEGFGKLGQSEWVKTMKEQDAKKGQFIDTYS